MNKKTNVFGILCIGISAVGFAQQEADTTKVEQLKEVVVSDSRFQLNREQSGKTIIKISNEEIERNQGRSISELINTKSGIEINGSRSVAGQNLGTYIRGGNNRQVLVLIDGIQVNDPSTVSNDFDLRLLDLNTVESIEIIKGATSVLYGNAAATAVINITTKKASKNVISGNFLSVIGTNQSQEDSDYDISSFNNNVSINGTLNKFSYLASFGNRFVDGLSAAKSEIPEKDVFSRYNTNLKLGYKSGNFQIDVFGSLDNLKTDIDGFPPPNFTIADTEDNYLSEQKRVGLFPKVNYRNGSIQVSAAYTEIERETISDFGSTHSANSYVVDAFNKYNFGDRFYTIVGLNYGDYRSEFSGEESFTNTDPYLNVVYVSDFGLNINAGTRLNNHSEYGSHLVYNANPSFRVKNEYYIYKVFGSYSTAFIAPNLSQLFGFFGANPDLQPEENRTIEAGLELNRGQQIRISGLYFNRNEKNTIIYTTGYENANVDATVHGVEIEAEFNFKENLTLNANYAFTELKDGIRLRIPKHKINTNLGYQISTNSFASIQYQYVGSREDLDFSIFENVELKPFHLMDLYISHLLLDNKVKLFASVTNLLDEDYVEIVGYTTRGRNVSLGLNLNL